MATTMRQRLISSTIALSVFGLAVTPVVASAASNSANTTINANIGAAISITTSSTVTISVTPTTGGVVSSSSDTVTVNTNEALGYTLTLSSSDTNTNLVNGGDNIAAHSGTFGSPTTLGNNTWGYRIVGAGGFGGTAYSGETNQGSSTSTWAGVPSSASPTTIKTTSSTAVNDTTTVWYGVKATASQPNGTYSDTVTYTATSN
ncbi:TPA: hypothetical protein DCF80_01905 [Candidatus Saccharibacteria bacterium]|nr:hypothetical protein [Candidatus Saccharibacteria bacterium]HRK40633.1 hypothetical protein [Candidatus Saccharibacteria bacterium]